MEDRSKVLSGALWSFDNDLIVSEELDGKGSIDEIDFSRCEFWVQIFQVPLLCTTRQIGWFLRVMIGEVVEVDGELEGDCVGNFLRVRVLIDITKLLRRCLRVDVMGDGVETIMLLSTSFTKGGFEEHMTNPVSTLNGVLAEVVKGKCKQKIVNSSMIEELDIVENVVALKSVSINASINAGKALQEIGCTSENLGPQYSDNINDNSVVINAIKIDDNKSKEVSDIEKSGVKSISNIYPMSKDANSLYDGLGLVQQTEKAHTVNKRVNMISKSPSDESPLMGNSDQHNFGSSRRAFQECIVMMKKKLRNRRKEKKRKEDTVHKEEVIASTNLSSCEAYGNGNANTTETVAVVT
ncbi:hypothetical protein QYF36_020518 [Acer negundo]|nr:hypothetical protein QYF36_020518 [Acer negundo]